MKGAALGTNPCGHSSTDFAGTEHSPNCFAEGGFCKYLVLPLSNSVLFGPVL